MSRQNDCFSSISSCTTQLFFSIFHGIAHSGLVLKHPDCRLILPRLLTVRDFTTGALGEGKRILLLYSSGKMPLACTVPNPHTSVALRQLFSGRKFFEVRESERKCSCGIGVLMFPVSRFQSTSTSRSSSGHRVHALLHVCPMLLALHGSSWYISGTGST